MGDGIGALGPLRPRRNARCGLSVVALLALALLNGCGLLPDQSDAGMRTGGETSEGSVQSGHKSVPTTGNQGGEVSPTDYTDSRYHYRVIGPGPMKAQSDGTASFSGEDEKFEVAIVEGTRAADPAALAEADLAALGRSASEFQVLVRPQAITLGEQRMIKVTYASIGKSYATGKPLKMFAVRYYIPKNSEMLALLTYRDAASEFDAKEAEGFAASFRWL